MASRGEFFKKEGKLTEKEIQNFLECCDFDHDRAAHFAALFTKDNLDTVQVILELTVEDMETHYQMVFGERKKILAAQKEKAQMEKGIFSVVTLTFSSFFVQYCHSFLLLLFSS